MRCVKSIIARIGENLQQGNRATAEIGLVTLTPTLSLRERGYVGWYSW